jgi:hypothetical protein
MVEIGSVVFRGEDLKKKIIPPFSIFSLAAIWLEVGITGHKLEGGHPRTIPPKFGCNWPSGF